MKSHKGFTLVELVVVIAIIGVLAAILVPNMLAYLKKAQLKSANTNSKTAYNAVVAHFVDLATQGVSKATIISDYCECDVDCGDTLAAGANSAQAEVHEVLRINGIDAGTVYIGQTTINGADSYYTQWTVSDNPGGSSQDIVGQYPKPITWDYYKLNGSTWGTYMS